MVELLMVIAILAMLGVLLLMGLPRVRESARRGSCQENLRQLLMAVKMYANESNGNYYPPLLRYTSVAWTPEQGEFYVAPCALPNPPAEGGQIQNTLDWPAVYPEYLADVHLNLCPSDPDRSTILSSGRWHVDTNADGQGDKDGPIDACAVTAESYGYLPWAVSVDAADEANLSVTDYIAGMVSVFNRRLQDGPKVFEENIEGTLTGHTIYRYREGIERVLTDDINHPDGKSQSDLPLIFDLVSIEAFRFSHVPGGANVGYLDGHVEFITYPGAFPVSYEFAMIAGVFGSS